MIKNEVWISSKNHHEQLTAIYASTSTIKKIFGAFKIPEGFPSLKLRWQMFPVVFEKKAAIEILTDRIIFSPYVLKDFNAFFNVDVNFGKEILFKNILRISTFINPKPFMKLFNVEWIDIRFIEEGIESELLICVGGKLMGTIKKETRDLFDSIMKGYKNN